MKKLKLKIRTDEKGEKLLKLKKRINIKLTTTKSANEIDLFDLGTLIQFETHAWRATKKLPKEVAARISTQKESDWIRATKNLINKKHLTQIYSKINEARQFITDAANPFPITGVYFLHYDRVNEANEILKIFKKDLDELKKEFSKNLSEYIVEAKKILEPDGLFNPSDYPVEIENSFSISWRFFTLTIPSQLKEDIKEQESNNFNKLIEETQKLVVQTMRNGFLEIITDLTNTLSGKLDGEKKRMNQGKIEKIIEFMNKFKRKDIFGDAELEELIVKAKDLVTGVDYKEIQKDRDLLNLLNTEMKEIKEQLVSMAEPINKRSVSFM